MSIAANSNPTGFRIRNIKTADLPVLHQRRVSSFPTAHVIRERVRRLVTIGRPNGSSRAGDRGRADGQKSCASRALLKKFPTIDAAL
jgi:hypothetical protein